MVLGLLGWMVIRSFYKAELMKMVEAAGGRSTIWKNIRKLSAGSPHFDTAITVGDE
jgi:hypothetical protein